MSRQAELAVTSFDHFDLKESLIAYLRTIPGFEDVNYEGSAISTIVDLLVRNATYTSFQANMVANESFIQSAQIRGNVSAHAQKLSYVPRSRTASRALVDIIVNPSDIPTEFVLTENAGLTFLASVGGETYTFTTRETQSFSYNTTTGNYQASDVTLYQGQYLRVRKTYTGEKISIDNRNVDTSTIRLTVDDGETVIVYSHATSLTDLSADAAVYFISENSQGYYEIEFGKDLVGLEPPIGSSIFVEYINTQDDIANNVESFIPASTIGGYSDIEVNVIQKSYGGYDRDSIEDIRFLAPRAYQAQNRALSPSDYEILIKESFPFIRSVRAWGGEDNDPPRFGNIMITIIPDAGLEVTSTLSNRIISTLQQKAVGSVTPIIVPSNIFELDLSVEYMTRAGVSNAADFSSIDAYIKSSIMTYSNEDLRRFDVYYNESHIIDVLKDRRDIESVWISKTISAVIDSFQLVDSIYSVNFENPIIPGSLKVTGFRISPTFSQESITDDENGNIIYTVNDSGLIRKQTLGTVDYSNGVIDFTARFVHDNGFIRVTAEPTEDNVYTSRSNTVEIVSVEVNRLQKHNFN